MTSLILLFLVMLFLGYELDYKLFNVSSIPANFDDELDKFMKDNNA